MSRFTMVTVVTGNNSPTCHEEVAEIDGIVGLSTLGEPAENTTHTTQFIHDSNITNLGRKDWSR